MEVNVDLRPETRTRIERALERQYDEHSYAEIDEMIERKLRKVYGPKLKLDLYRLRHPIEVLRRKAEKARCRSRLITQEEIDYARKRAMILKVKLNW
jgi:hypothetical protein